MTTAGTDANIIPVNSGLSTNNNIIPTTNCATNRNAILIFTVTAF